MWDYQRRWRTLFRNKELKMSKKIFNKKLFYRSVMDIKKILINSDDLAPFGHEEDLATKLGLRRSSQLFVDFWKKGQKTTLVNPQGTTVTYYYVEGDAPLELLLMPTNSM